MVFIVAVKCFYVFASKEETLSPQWEIFIFHRRVQWAHSLLNNTPDRSTAAHSHTSELSKCQLSYTEHLNYSSWESSALLKGTLTRTAFNCALAITCQSSSLAKQYVYLPETHISNQPACFCTAPDKPVELFVAMLWCQPLHYFYYWLLHSTGWGSNRHKERLLAIPPQPWLLWMYADQ